MLANRTRSCLCSRHHRPDLRGKLREILRIRFNHQQRHNAFSIYSCAALLEALAVAQLDPSMNRYRVEQ